ncbi:hypothetical protein SAMN05443665_100696 [Actinomadura meyerae]|uniref:Prolyl oligopeptidase family protein n=1 Tax=Actinomadura meyerae TaxID=240840 RepID=A0A239FPS1_9ACTN|nr:hypothetical protein [Actinomadura meyerae]SNS58202.1 hypothetical protein SAMN05443665_100696 [Actinomadura meyerae]
MRIRALTALVATVLASVVPLGPAQAGRTPDDQPLPGYTVDNPPLPPVQVHGAPSRVLQGVHRHAAYIIEVPPHWNGRLALYAHGYAGQGFVLSVGPPPFGLRQRLLDQGYAWAASSYYANGYDVRAGVLSTRDVSELFAAEVGRPRQRVIVGVSMGGHVIGRSIEQYPGYYDGALPMCGVLGDDELFDYFLDYNLVAQDLAGIREYPVTDRYATVTVPKIEEALGLTALRPGGPDTVNERGGQFRSIVIDRTGGTRPGAVQSFAYWKDYPFTLATPSTPDDTLAENPGQLATNLFTRYRPNEPVDVNASVQRVRVANLPARLSNRLSQVPRINGRPHVPVLSLHGLGDLFVPFSMEQVYASEVARNHRSRLLVQRAIRTTGHCEFSAAEAGTAWDDLVRWIGTGRRPAGDVTTRPREVARADYGCRFSDEAAYAAGAGTRRLFPACP